MEKLNTAYRLSIAVAILAAVAAAGGLLLPGLYRDNDFIKSAWFGNDLVTLLVAVPLLGAALYFSQKGSLRAQLVWMGALAYMIYNYAFYLFGAAFNKFFLVYVALFALSFYALVLGLSNLDIEGIKKRFDAKLRVQWISVYLFLISIPLIIVEGGQCLNFILTDKLPEVPALIFALDLAVVVPNTALAGVLLWQRRAWGYVLGAMMLVKGLTYGLVLMTGTSLIALTGAGAWDPLMPFYTFVTVGAFTCLFIFLKNMN